VRIFWVNRTKIELSLDARIRQLLEHYKQDDPLGIPGVPIPDPMPIPDFEGDFPAAKIKFSEAELQQLSQFRINYVRTDLKDLKVRNFPGLDNGLKDINKCFVFQRFGLV